MTASIRSFLKKRKFKHLELILNTYGDWSPHDSEWNYSDVLHFPHVHKVFDQLIIDINNKSNSSFFLQKILFLNNPLLIYQEHTNKEKHEYVATSYGITISIITEHRDSKVGALTITNYRFYYNNFLGFIFALIAKFATKKNYKKVMAEDLPLRVQRGLLRKTKNIDFKMDNILISPIATSNAQDNNVSLKKSLKLNKTFKLSQTKPLFILHDFFIKFSLINNKVFISSTICPHEGSPLDDCEIINRCKWHGRLIKPYYEFIFLSNFEKKVFFHLNRKFIFSSFLLNNEQICQIKLDSKSQ